MGPTEFVARVQDRPDSIYEYMIDMAQSDAVVDWDKRMLLFWCWLDDDRTLCLSHILDAIRRHWPGWEVRYAFQERAEAEDYLGWFKGEFVREPHEVTVMVSPLDAAVWFEMEAEDDIGFPESNPTYRYSETVRKAMLDYAQYLRRQGQNGL